MLQLPFAGTAGGKKPQVHVFDKHEDRTFRTSPENILQARDFNTFERDGVTCCLEDGMGAIEDQAAPVLRKIMEERSIAALTVDERGTLMVFVALQKIRGVDLRTSMLDMGIQMRDRVRAMGGDPDRVPQLRGGDDPQEIKLSSLRFVEQNLAEFARSYANKALVLMEAAPGETFLLGDTPVVWANQNDTGPSGNLGLEVAGIEIYLPISPQLTIAFWCPSNVVLLEDALKQVERSLNVSAGPGVLGVGPEAERLRRMRQDLQERAKKLRADLAAVRTGHPLSSSHDNMDYLNSLQVAQAERYILSATGDFSLVRQIIADNPKRRRGQRAELV